MKHRAHGAFSYIEVMVAMLIFSMVSVTIMNGFRHSLRLTRESRYQLIAMQIFLDYQAWRQFSHENTLPVEILKMIELLPAGTWSQLPNDQVAICWQVDGQQCVSG